MRHKPEFVMLYGGRLHVDWFALERIVQAAVLLSERVLVPAEAQAAPRLPQEERLLITQRLRELEEMRAVRVLRIEGRWTGGRTDRLGNLVPANRHVVVGADQHAEVYDVAVGRSMDRLRALYHATPRPQGEAVQGVTEFVEGRRQFWLMALARSLNAGRILVRDRARIALAEQLSKFFRHDVIEAPVLREFLDVLSVGPISVLEGTELDECRRFAVGFRRKFLQVTADACLELEDEGELIRRLAAALVEEYTEALERIALDRASSLAVKRLTETGGLSMRGYSVPAADAQSEVGRDFLGTDEFPWLGVAELRHRLRAKRRRS